MRVSNESLDKRADVVLTSLLDAENASELPPLLHVIANMVRHRLAVLGDQDALLTLTEVEDDLVLRAQWRHTQVADVQDVNSAVIVTYAVPDRQR